MKCKICPFQFSLPCSECELPFKERKKEIRIKIWIKRIKIKRVKRKDELPRKHECKTVIEFDGKTRKEKWKKRALRRLRKEFHCNASLKDNQIILNGNFISSKQKIIQLLSFFIFNVICVTSVFYLKFYFVTRITLFTFNFYVVHIMTLKTIQS